MTNATGMTRRELLKEIAKIFRVKGAWKKKEEVLLEEIKANVDKMADIFPERVVEAWEMLVEYDTLGLGKPIPADLWNKISDLNQVAMDKC